MTISNINANTAPVPPGSAQFSEGTAANADTVQAPVYGGGATAYEPANQSPIQCAPQYIPEPATTCCNHAPIVDAPTQAPDPIDTSVPAPNVVPPAPVDVTQLPDPIEIVTPTSPSTKGQQGQPIAGGWSDSWLVRFAELGLSVEDLQKIQQRAIESQASDLELLVFHRQLTQQMYGPAQVTNPQTTGPQAPNAPQPGWNAEYQARFAELGMPESVIQVYAESGAPAAGIERALENATARAEDFKARGWYEKFEKAGVKEDQIWALILAEKPLTDEELGKELSIAKKAELSMPKRIAQLALNLIPGGYAVQYAAGKNLVSGAEVERSDKLPIAGAVLSGVALLAATRGGLRSLATVKNGLAAHKAGFPALSKMGVTTAGESVSAAARGASLQGSTPSLTKTMLNGGLRRQVSALGHAENAASAMIRRGADLDPLQARLAGQMFDGIKLGTTKVNTGGLSRIPFKSTAPARLTDDTLTFASTLKPTDGRAPLVGIVNAGGERMASNPAWLAGKPRIVGKTNQLSNMQLTGLGQTSSTDAARRLGFGESTMLSRVLDRSPNSQISKLANAETPAWYGKFASNAGQQARIGAGDIQLADDIAARAHAAATALPSKDRAVLEAAIEGIKNAKP